MQKLYYQLLWILYIAIRLSSLHFISFIFLLSIEYWFDFAYKLYQELSYSYCIKNEDIK